MTEFTAAPSCGGADADARSGTADAVPPAAVAASERASVRTILPNIQHSKSACRSHYLVECTCGSSDEWSGVLDHEVVAHLDTAALDRPDGQLERHLRA